jgi:hypothetical protein
MKALTEPGQARIICANRERPQGLTDHEDDNAARLASPRRPRRYEALCLWSPLLLSRLSHLDRALSLFVCSLGKS